MKTKFTVMFAIIDLETTGYGPKGNKITEVAIFLHDGEKVIDEYTSLVNPECQIPYRIQQITGIDNEMVKDAPKFYEIAKKVFQMTEDAIFVAHNVGFDYGVLRAEYKELGAEYKRKKLCTVRMSRKLIPESPRHGLGHITKFLGIEINGRHRAYGDAKATVELFERLLELDSEKVIPQALNIRSREASLPPNLDREDFDKLPLTPGVYYFKNEQGKDIYIGKAKQIKKRVMSHFHSKLRKEVRLFEAVHGLDFKETGNELVALLLESDEIKRKYPLFNTAQKRSVETYAMFSYEDRSGILHLAYGRTDKVSNAAMRFYSISQARNFIEMLMDEFELCPRYCQIQSSNGACFHYGLKQCKGVCAKKEEIAEYNERVRNALSSIPNIQGDFVIIETGRTEKESAFVLIDKGLYKGFGYFPKKSHPTDKHDYLSLMQPMRDNRDTRRLIASYLKSEEEREIIYLEPSEVDLEHDIWTSVFGQ